MSSLSPGQHIVLAKYPDAEWITPNERVSSPSVPIHPGPSLEAIIAKYGRGLTPPPPAESDDTEVVIALVRGRRRTFVVQGEAIIAENG